MARNFLNNLNLAFAVADGRYDVNSSLVVCEEVITHYEFYHYTLIAAVVITLTFIFTRPRRRARPDLCHGRPGIIFPLDILTRTHRISYACAFGAMAYLVYEIVLEQTFAIKYTGDDRAVKSFVAIASMVIYGLVFYPLFTSLAIDSVYGYVLAALYVWLLTAMHIYRIYGCDGAALRARIMALLRGLPSALCLLYLCISIPARAVISMKNGYYFSWRERYLETKKLSDIRVSYSGLHVSKLFCKPEVKTRPETTKGYIIGTLMSMAHQFIYQRKAGFRYPSLVMAVLFTAILVIYEMTFEVLVLSAYEFRVIGNLITGYVDEHYGMEVVPGESQQVTDEREVLLAFAWVLAVVRICLIISAVLASVFALLNVLHALSSYRANLYALYRGDHSQMPPVATYSNASHCVGSIKYAGYQVGYIIWSYVIQGVTIFLLSILLAALITLLKNGYISWFVWLLGYIWPVLVTFVVMMTIQFLMAKFVFLQEHGRYLALDNREIYFNFTYFMFFYNIFLGAASCLLRILKAMLLGLAFLSRLDSSTLSRRFEFFDPGFKSYVGYMHLEAAHTHPVMVVFCKLMLLELGEKTDREEKKAATAGRRRTPSVSSTEPLELVTVNNQQHLGPHENGSVDNGPKASTTVPSTPDLQEDEEKRRRRMAACFNWHLLYTLLHNPDIRVLRKGFLQMLRQARLMGVHIPVSDRHDDINYQQLHERLADAKEKMHPSSKKNGLKRRAEVDSVELTKVVTIVEDSGAGKATNVGTAGVQAAQVKRHSAAISGEMSSAGPTAEPQKEAVDELHLPSISAEAEVNPLRRAGSADIPQREETQRKKAEGSVAPVADVPPVQVSHRDDTQVTQPGQVLTQQGGKHHAAVSLDMSNDNCITVCL